jgi:hypothetical protein
MDSLQGGTASIMYLYKKNCDKIRLTIYYYLDIVEFLAETEMWRILC